LRISLKFACFCSWSTTFPVVVFTIRNKPIEVLPSWQIYLVSELRNFIKKQLDSNILSAMKRLKNRKSELKRSNKLYSVLTRLIGQPKGTEISWV
jgi:hypothetical protein